MKSPTICACGGFWCLQHVNFSQNHLKLFNANPNNHKAKINKDQIIRLEVQLSIESMDNLFLMPVLNLPVKNALHYEDEIKFL